MNEFGEPSWPSLASVFDSLSYAAVIAEGVAEGRDYAFEGCAGLVRVSLPTGLTTIGTHAFTECAVAGVFIPAQVSSIGNAAFSWCWRLESITVDGANPRYCSLNGVLLDRAGGALVQCPTRKTGDFPVPADVTQLADYAFVGCALMDGLYFKERFVVLKAESFRLYYSAQLQKGRITIMLSEFVKTADWKSEKHVPVIVCADSAAPGAALDITVTVGKEIAHPNTTNHHISWIALHFVPAGAKASVEIGRCEFTAHGESVEGADKGPAYTDSTLSIRAKLAVSGTLYATSYCNIHGLWASEKAIAIV